MMTSAKTASLPLLLPWAIAVLPSLKLILRWPLKTLAVCAIAIFASALPTMVLNAKYSGDWSGADLSHGTVKNAAILKAGANAGLIALHNLTPPVFPFASAWNLEVVRLMPAGLTSQLSQVMVEPQAVHFTAEEMQMEENAGLGFVFPRLFLVSVAGARFSPGRKRSPPAFPRGKSACAGRRWFRCSR